MIDERNERQLATADVAAAAGRTEESAAGDPRDRELLHDREVERARASEPGAARAGTAEEPLLDRALVSRFQNRWDEIQTGFVDEPRRAVEEADALVALAIRELAQSFANERAGLERQWDRGDDVSTEDLRQSLQRYRSFFGRLLSI